MNRTPTVLLVEDDAPTRQRISLAISADPTLQLVGEASSHAEGRAQLERLRPDVLVTDLDLRDGSGIDLIRQVHALDLSALCMVITIFGDEKHVAEAIQAGALGYLLKDARAESIAQSIHDLVAGGSPISPPIARYLMTRLRAPDETATRPAGETARALASDTQPRQIEAPPSVSPLSEREHEVLGAVVKGFSYGEIAALLGISSHTIATHIRRIYQKLAVHSKSEAVYEALQLGIVKLDD